MKQIKINLPEGYVIDEEKTDFKNGIIECKKVDVVPTYLVMARKLFNKIQNYPCMGDRGIKYVGSTPWNFAFQIPTLGVTIEQTESVIAVNQLCNVASYLNEGWLPELGKAHYLIYIKNCNESDEYLCVTYHQSVLYGLVYFRTQELALRAIEILGNDVVRKALVLNH